MKLWLTLATLSFSIFFSDLCFAIEARLRIGVIRPQSGPSAPLGEELWEGVQLAFALHRQQTPQIASLVEIVEADDEGRPSQASIVAENLIQRQRVHALIGSVSNHLNVGIADVAMRRNRLTILPYATQEKLQGRGENIFTVSLGEEEQGRILGEFAVSTLKKQRVIIFVEKDNPYSLSLANGFRRVYQQAGGNVLATIEYSSFHFDQAEVLEDLQKAGPAELVFIPGYYRDAARIIQMTRPRLPPSTVFLGGDSWDDPQLNDMLPATTEIYYYHSPFSLTTDSTRLKGFIGRYQRQYNRPPSAMSYFGFAAMDTLLSTYLKANSNRTEALRRQLSRPDEMRSLLGPIQVTPSGLVQRPSSIVTIQSGRSQHFQAITPTL